MPPLSEQSIEDNLIDLLKLRHPLDHYWQGQ
jgi:hypothetical protein